MRLIGDGTLVQRLATGWWNKTDGLCLKTVEQCANRNPHNALIYWHLTPCYYHGGAWPIEYRPPPLDYIYQYSSGALDPRLS